MLDADLSSNAASLEGWTNKPKHYILRRKDSISVETESSSSKPFISTLKAQPQTVVPLHHPPAEAKSPRNLRRCGKADWRPDVSSALFSASGRQYGSGDHRRGYHSNTYVTHLSYPESIIDQPRESRRLKFLRHFKCWHRHSDR